MGCCGSKRAQFNTSSTSLLQRPAAPAVASMRVGHARPVFMYQGSVPLTLIGRVSGMRYCFAQLGARLAVDPRDAAIMAATPSLVRVR
jgi:hypothetical protein